MKTVRRRVAVRLSRPLSHAGGMSVPPVGEPAALEARSRPAQEAREERWRPAA